VLMEPNKVRRNQRKFVEQIPHYESHEALRRSR
jgi:hypothetical protein